MKQRFKLVEVGLPNFGVPDQFPILQTEVYENRLAQLRRRSTDVGLQAIVVYADREHFANLSYLCGFDPRFEEALLVFGTSADPVLITGPENQSYSQVSPLDMDVKFYPTFGLLGQERGKPPSLEDLLSDAGLVRGMSVGVIGWKYFTASEAVAPDRCLEIPSFIAEAIRRVVGADSVVNATALLMHPSTGLRSRNEVAQIVQFEYAATHVSEAVKRVLASLRPGISERALADHLHLGRLPLSCHPMISSGSRTRLGLASPSDKVVERAEPFQIAIGVWGGLTCRAGWVTESADDLPQDVQDYVERLAGPYFACAAAWYETIGIGVTGGTLDALAKSHLGDRFFGVSLNPGHLIHLDEWMNTPIYPGSTEMFHSGHAVQLDIIPATGTPYGTANIEDGIALLDEHGRSEFQTRFPEAWSRIVARREFMSECLNIKLKPEVLPLSNLAGYFAPFMLAPSQVLVHER